MKEALRIEDVQTLNARELLNRLDDYRLLASELGQAHAKHEHLIKMKEEQAKVCFDQLVIRFQEIDKISSTLARAHARTHHLYQTKYKEYLDTVEEALKIQIDYDVAMKSIDTLRSIAFVLNNELKLAQGR